MNIHNRFWIVLVCGILSFALLGFRAHKAIAQECGSGHKSCCLQTKLIGKEIYSFDFECNDEKVTPIFLHGLAQGSEMRFERCYLFQSGFVPHPTIPLQWDLMSDRLFVARCVDNGPITRAGVGIWPFSKLIPGPPRQGQADRVLDMSDDELRAWSLDSSVLLLPAMSAQQGWVILTDTGYEEQLQREHQVVNWTFWAINESKIGLYLSVDSRLSLWTFDREEKNGASSWLGTWKHQRTWSNATTVEGPFLVLDRGRSALISRDGKWGLLAPLGEASPQFTAIVERDGDEPIRIVEDRDAGVNYFIYKDDILDAQGRVLDRVPPGLDSEERLIHLTRFALGRRAPK